MPRTYIVSGGNLTLANAAVTLAFINPGTTASLSILRVWASQHQATAAPTLPQQRIQLNTQVTAFPTLVAATPAKTNPTDPVSVITGATTGAAGTAGINASAENGGAKTVLFPDVFHVQNGYLWVNTPDEIFVEPAGAAAGFGVHLPVAAAVLTGWAAGIVYREL